MKTVKLMSSRTGHRFDKKGNRTGAYVQNAGDVVEMENDEAQRHIDRGLAVAVKEQK